MPKRLFEILDEMNVADTENKTANLQVGNSVIAADKVTGGTKVSMAAPAEAIFQIMNGEVIPILLLVNKAEYNRLTTQ